MLFEYTRFPGALTTMPVVDIALRHGEHEISMPALVDSGAMMSVLPYEMGLQLGLVWEEQRIEIPQAGALHGIPAKGVELFGKVAECPEARLAFAWIHEAPFNIRLILGQLNFFREFKVTFEGYDDAFDISPKP